jgi:hypothetical protein
MITAIDTPTLMITTTPTPRQLKNWWQEMHADPEDLRVAFNDFMPDTLSAFLRQDLLLTLCHAEDRIAAAGWLHDYTRDTHGLVVEGWIGGWIAKPCRGQIGRACWQLVLDYFVERGVTHIHSAINIANSPSFVFTKRIMRFTLVGRFPRLSPFGGIRTDMHILTLHAADRARAWRAAAVLAQQRWPEEALPRPWALTQDGKTCLLD